MNRSFQHIICLMGPTATGKTHLAIQLAQRFPIDIISVDSAMVYCGLDIGTAKPKVEELAVAPHLLIDICDPAEPYSAGRFYVDALHHIKSILQQNRIPLLVGGSMLYFWVLQQGMVGLPSADPSIRAALTKEASLIGWKGMYNKLKAIDPAMAIRLHPNDSQRIQRALEVYKITGKAISELQSIQENQASFPFRIFNIALIPEYRIDLHSRIAERFDLMLDRGFLEEVKGLQNRQDLHNALPSIRTVGYRQAWDYLHGKYDSATMRERAIIATRQLAKRQLTWLRRWEGSIVRYYFDKLNLVERVVKDIERELDND